MVDNDATDASNFITEPAEDEDGYRHGDLEVGSTVVYEGEVDTVASIGRSAIRLEGRETAVREGGIDLVVGTIDDDDEDAATEDEITAEANDARKRGEGDRAKEFALVETDADDQDFVRERGSFDIGFNLTDNNRLVGQGEDFSRLEKRHQRRSERAQTIDEQQSAKKTRNPIKWANNPNEYDYPGIDTVQPRELHEERSERAQSVDEREIAPTADTKQEWARSPDEHDWPGVDRPNSYGPTADTPLPESERGGDFGRRQRPGEDLVSDDVLDQNLSGTPLAPADFVEGAHERFTSDKEFPQLAAGQDADMAFKMAEEQRAGSNDSSDIGFVDDRARDGSLVEFGMEADATQSRQERESREAVEQATEFGVDDRSNDALGENGPVDTTETGLEEFGGGTRDNEDLFSF